MSLDQGCRCSVASLKRVQSDLLFTSFDHGSVLKLQEWNLFQMSFGDRGSCRGKLGLILGFSIESLLMVEAVVLLSIARHLS
jgi:hypothetical protein